MVLKSETDTHLAEMHLSMYNQYREQCIFCKVYSPLKMGHLESF